MKITERQQSAMADGLGQDKSGLVQSCPANLTVTVVYKNDQKPIEGAQVKITGPSSREGKTDKNGKVEFRCIEPGSYEVNAKYETGSPLVDAAKKRVNSTDWAYDVSKGPYGPNTNKCNLFVHDMTSETGTAPPMKSRWSLRELGKVEYPTLAGDWGTPSTSVPGWTPVTDPQPGDVIAEAHQYSDASGHTGIVSYPKPDKKTVSVAAGETKEVKMELERQTISAAHDSVLENDWGYRPGQKPVFRRHTGSP